MDLEEGESSAGAIEALETELDALEEAGERARKTIVVAKGTAAAGAILFAIALWRGDALAFTVGIAALLGGLALVGSTTTTRRQIMASIAALEERRSLAIDALAIPGRIDPAETG